MRCTASSAGASPRRLRETRQTAPTHLCIYKQSHHARHTYMSLKLHGFHASRPDLWAGIPNLPRHPRQGHPQGDCGKPDRPHRVVQGSLARAKIPRSARNCGTALSHHHAFQICKQSGFGHAPRNSLAFWVFKRSCIQHSMTQLQPIGYN